jgi:tRNA(Ile)-lysidine synthetase-like protein
LALQRAVLREQLLSLGQVPDFELVERLRLHPDSRQSAPHNEGYRLAASGGLSRQPINVPASPYPVIHLELSGSEGSVAVGGRELVWKISSQPQPLGTLGLEQFDMAKIGGTRIFVRSWLPGDRFRPLGYPCAAKLHDIFISHKIPRERRSQALVFETLEKRIFWVEGLPLGEEFKIDATTGLILTLSVRRPHGL